MSFTKAAIIEANTWTKGIKSIGGYNEERDIGVSIAGSFVAVVTIQRSLEGDIEGNYEDLATTYSSATELNVIGTRNAWYRAGVKTGNFTSGQVNLKILA